MMERGTINRVNHMQDILVSIITVCYNSEKTIRQTMDSVLKQTYSNIEYIVVDGASTDGTLEIIEEFKSQFGVRMRCISESDSGIYDAMNKGIRMATGEVIGIINSDDYYELNAIEKVVRAYNKGGCAVLYGEMRTWIDGKEESVWIGSPEFLGKRMIAHPACFVTKNTYDKYGVFDTRYCSVADYDLMLRYKKCREIQFVPIYEVLANFRSGGMCSTQKAFFELLDLQVRYGMISKHQRRSQRWKAKVSNAFSKLKR